MRFRLTVEQKSLRRALVRTYLTIDRRSLALCRIVLAITLIVDLYRRIPWLRDLYSNAGLLPNHTILWRPPQPRLFSFFLMASNIEEAEVGFAIAFVCFFLLLVGWHTRIFHWLSFAMMTSLHCRILPAENWGAVALAVLMLWTGFLPTGSRFSVDALLASLRAGRDERPEDLEASRIPDPDRRPVVSLAVLAILLQLAVIYWLNFVHKSGTTWRTGTAIHYTLYQERIITILGVWTREHLPFSATRALTYGTLAIEGSAPFLILSPVFYRQTRLLAIVLLTGLHTSIALLVNLGIFSAAMISFYPLLLDADQWDWVARRWRASGRRVWAFYDADCGVCFQVVRVLARFDLGRRVMWIPNRDVAKLPPAIDRKLLSSTVLVVDPESHRRWTRSDAFARIFAALPLGSLFAWVLLVPGIRDLAGAAYDAFAGNRTKISTWLGLSACSVTGGAESGVAKGGASDSLIPADAPIRRFVRWVLPRMRELGVVFALVVLGGDVSVSNGGIPREFRWENRPTWMASILMYPHIIEGWGMFSPEAPLYDEMVVVDAVTTDGRHVDPYNEVGSRVHTLPVDDIPVRLGHDSMFCDYTVRIPYAAPYQQAFIEWVQRYPERTGNPRDAIVSFEAFKLEHNSPGPGETRPTNVRKTVFLTWPRTTSPRPSRD